MAQAGDRESARQSLREHALAEGEHQDFAHRAIALACHEVAALQRTPTAIEVAGLLVPTLTDVYVDQLLAEGLSGNQRMEAAERCREADRQGTEQAQAGDLEAAKRTQHEHAVAEADHPDFPAHTMLAQAIDSVASRAEPPPPGHAAGLVVPWAEDLVVRGLLALAAEGNERS